MASYNRVILMGNLTRDPELRTLPNSQTAVCDFALAVNRRWKDATGTDREDVLFIDCAAFGKTGQTIGENLTKGRPIHIEGHLRFEHWEQEDGQRRSKIRVVVEQFRFVDRKPGSEPAAGMKSTRTRKPSTKRRPVDAEPAGALAARGETRIEPPTCAFSTPPEGVKWAGSEFRHGLLAGTASDVPF